MMNQLLGKAYKKKILITGSESLIAQNLIKSLSPENYLICLDVKQANKSLKKFSNIESYKINLSSEKQIYKLKKKIKKKHNKIDVIINCFVNQNYNSFENQNFSNFKNSLLVNVGGLFLITKYFYKMLVGAKNSQIINFGSIYGIVSGDPRLYPNKKFITSDVYAASKAAIIHLTKYYAVHLSKYKIRVNCISPGGILNNQERKLMSNYNKKVPLKRMCKVDEIVSCVNFLLDEKCTYMNGHNLVADGGFTIW